MAIVYQCSSLGVGHDSASDARSALNSHLLPASYCDNAGLMSGAVGWWVWLFTISKIAEFVDTIFVVSYCTGSTRDNDQLIITSQYVKWREAWSFFIGLRMNARFHLKKKIIGDVGGSASHIGEITYQFRIAKSCRSSARSRSCSCTGTITSSHRSGVGRTSIDESFLSVSELNHSIKCSFCSYMTTVVSSISSGTSLFQTYRQFKSGILAAFYSYPVMPAVLRWLIYLNYTVHGFMYSWVRLFNILWTLLSRACESAIHYLPPQWWYYWVWRMARVWELLTYIYWLFSIK